MLRAPVIAAALAVLAATPAPAAAQSELNIIQPIIRGLQVWPIHVGEMLGYFEEEGLTVNLVASDATVPFAVFLASGDADLALLSSIEMFHAVSADFGVTGIYTVHHRVPQGVFVDAAGPIYTAADLAGRTVGLATDHDLSTLQIAMANQGASADSVETIIVGETGPVMTSVFSRGVADAFVGPVTSMTALAVQGIEVRDVATSNAPSNTYVIRADRIEELREPVCGFLRAWSKGVYIGQRDIEIIGAMSRHPDGVPEQWEIPEFGHAYLYQVADLVIPPGGEGPIGRADPAAWAAVQDDLLMIGEIDEPHDVSSFLSDTFLSCANDFDRNEVMAEARAWMDDPANAEYARTRF